MKIIGQAIYSIGQEVRLTEEHTNCTHIGEVMDMRLKSYRGLRVVQYKVLFPTLHQQSKWHREKDLVSNTKFNYIALLIKRFELWITG